MRRTGWVFMVALAGAVAAPAEAVQLSAPAPAEVRQAGGDGKPARLSVSDKADPKADKAPAVKPAKAEPVKGEGKVNINAANKAQLMTLEGVGPSAARRIIEHREANGPFKKPEDLAKVDGVGKSVLEKNHGRIVIR